MENLTFISTPSKTFRPSGSNSSSLRSLKPAITSPAVAPIRRAVSCTAAEGQSKKLAWVDAIPLSEVQPGCTYRRILANLDICFACDEGGEIYAVGNKGPPLGIPLSDGQVVTVDVSKHDCYLQL